MTPKKILLLVFFLLLLSYALFEARFLIIGPHIKVTSPKNGEVVETGLINITGTAKNAAWLSLDDRQIFTDKSGHFFEEMVLAPGPNVLTIRAKDRFGREREQRLEVVVKYGNDKEENQQASTTPSE